jgi:outer membrane protein with beta-barrel domain
MRGAGVAAVLLCAALGEAVGSAQTDGEAPHGPWQLSLFGGGWNAIGTAYLYRTPSGTADVGFGNAPAFGVSAGLDVSRLSGLELSWMQTSPAQQYAGSPPTPIRTVRLDIFELDSLWYFRRGGFQPYGIFGVGGASTGSSFGGTNFTAAAGIGVKAFLGPHFAVRADVRADATYGNVGHPGAPAFCDAAGCYDYRSSWSWSLPVTAGLTYAF